jgi:hypothetical protein
VIINFQLLFWCVVLGGAYLLIADLIWNAFERLVPTFKNFPRELIDAKGVVWFVCNYIVEFIFFVLMPAVIYGWFYAVIPFSGTRGGLAFALLLLVFGMVPFAILVSFRIRLPVVFILYQLLGMLLKIFGTLAIIGYLYSL